MNELPINWKQERPNSAELAELWTSIQLLPLDNWTLSTTTLIEKIAETHCNGGIQLHKYEIAGNRHFDWFVQRNRLDEIDFLKNIFRHKNLENYRTDLAIRENSPEVIHVKYWTDIYDLTGQLSRIMGLGGSYKNIDQKEAWTTASDFVKDEFENRFEGSTFTSL